MRASERKMSLGDIILLFIILSLSYLFIPAWIPFLRKGWQLLIVATFIILISKRGYIYYKAIPAFLLYGLILCLNASVGDELVGSVTNAINEIMMLFVSSSLALFCARSENRKFVSSLLWISFIALLVEMVSSFIVLEFNPGIIRGMHAIVKEENDISVMYDYYKLGIVDYSMAHAIPIIVPPFICQFKEGKIKEKIIYGALITACIFLVWLSESSTAMLLIVLMLFLGFLVNTKATLKKQTIIIGVVVFFTIILLSNNFIMKGLLSVADSAVGDESTYKNRIEEIKYLFLEDQTVGDLESRIDRYKKSINYFFSNPILGTNLMPGRHSSLLDILATVGLIGFIPLVVFFYMYLKKIMIMLSINRKAYYLESCVAAFLMALFKGVWVWPIFLFLFIVAPSILSINQPRKK